MRKTITVAELIAFIEAAKARGELTDTSEVRVYTGWEGPEDLPAGANVSDAETPRSNYLIIHQA